MEAVSDLVGLTANHLKPNEALALFKFLDLQGRPSFHYTTLKAFYYYKAMKIMSLRKEFSYVKTDLVHYRLCQYI